MRDDEEPEPEDWELWEAEKGVPGCSFCGHADHLFKACPNRLFFIPDSGQRGKYTG